MNIFKFITFFLLQSCAGYKLIGETNIFKEHGVSSIVIDQTKNASSFSSASRFFANTISTELSSLSEVNIQNKLGYVPNEAVVVTELSSEINPSMSKVVEAVKFIDKTTGYGDSIGSRAGFYVNSQVRYKLNLNVTVIKDPKGSLRETGEKAKVIFKKVYPVTFQMNNSLQPISTTNRLGISNYVMNKSVEEKAFELAAKDVAASLRRDLEH